MQELISDECRKTRFKKFQAEYIVKVLNKGYNLTNADYYEMLSNSGYRPDFLTLTKIKRIMQNEIVKQDTDNKLIQFYISRKYDDDYLDNLLQKVVSTAESKQNSSVLFEVFKHIENRLRPESKVKVTQQEHLNTDQELTSISRTITKEVNE